MEYISVHRIVMGGKGNRQVIDANKRFDSEDYAEHMPESEIARLLREGAIRSPGDPSYAVPQTGVGQATATMGRTPRLDTNDPDAELRRRVMGVGADEPAELSAEEEGQRAAAAVAAQRGGRRRPASAPATDDDDDDDKL
jgi:hypothetical protein